MIQLGAVASVQTVSAICTQKFGSILELVCDVTSLTFRLQFLLLGWAVSLLLFCLLQELHRVTYSVFKLILLSVLFLVRLFFCVLQFFNLKVSLEVYFRLILKRVRVTFFHFELFFSL